MHQLLFDILSTSKRQVNQGYPIAVLRIGTASTSVLGLLEAYSYYPKQSRMRLDKGRNSQFHGLA